MMKRLIAWVITLTLLMSLVPQIAFGVTAEEVQTPPEAHSHCAQQHACDHCDEAVTWTPWDKTNALPTDSGHYYLTGDVTVTARTTLKGTVDQVLCLNGYTIDASAKDIVFYMQDSAKLTVDDCTAYTDAEGVLHAGVIRNGKQTGSMPSVIYVKGTAELTVKNCYISGNTHVKNNNTAAGYGGAVQIRSESSKAVHAHLENIVFEGNVCGQDGGALNVRGSKATATVKNCVFKDNEAVNGGAVYVTGTTVDLIDCRFETNKASIGSAVYVTAGTVNMTNCLVEDNTASANGGAAIRLNAGGNAVLDGCTIKDNKVGSGGGSAIHTGGKNCNLTLKDCTVTGNTHTTKGTDYRGAVYMTNTSEKLTVIGKTVIDDNYKKDSDGNQVETGIYLQSNPNTVDVGGLTEGAKISIYTRNLTAETPTMVTAATEPTAWNRTWVVYDNTGFAVDYNTTDGFFFAVNTDHIHCECGKTDCTDTTHKNVEYLNWEKTDDLPTAGNYCLKTDVQLTAEVSISGDLNLCLNGHTVSTTAGKRIYSTPKNLTAVVTISDCTATTVDGVYTAGKLTGGVDKGTNAGGGAIYIRAGGTLKLYDGIITGNTSDLGGGGIMMGAGSKLYMYGGEISGNTAVTSDGKTWKSGGGIYLASGAEGQILGGTIKDNKGNGGGGVYVYTGAKLIVSGATISNNTASTNGGGIYSRGESVTVSNAVVSGNYGTKDGGGIYVRDGNLDISGDTVISENETAAAGGGISFGSNSSGTISGAVIEKNKGSGGGMIIQNGADVTITDAIIRSNTSSSIGGIRVVNAKLTLAGGTITENVGGSVGGIHVAADAQLQLSGEPTIIGNIAKEKASNLHLAGDVVFGLGELGENAKIAVSAEKVFRAISTETETDHSAKFTSDKTNMQVVYQDKALYIGASGDHKHCLCVGLSSVGCTHDAVPFAQWDDPNSLPASGNWYLATDVSLTNRIEVYDELNLCLNGHTITANGVENAGTDLHFKVMDQGTLSITDCTENPGKLTGGTYGTVLFNWDTSGGTFNLYNGILTGNEGNGSGGAVMVQCSKEEGNTFNMYGGKITGNTEHAYLKNGAVTGGKGGGVYVLRSTFNMYGGEISDNQAFLLEHEGKKTGGRGGGIYAEAGATVNLLGGKISGNTATSDGGGLYVISKNTVVTLNGTEISGNTAANAGGGMITATASHLEFKGGKISKNKAASGAGLYISTITTVTMTGGEISGNTAATSGGGVAMYKSTADFKGGKITGNKATTSGGGIYISQKEASAVFDGTEVSKNTSKNGGGMIVVTLATVELKSGKFTGNTTTSGGAGIYVSTNSVFKMTGGQVTGNTAKSSGGGIYCLRSTVTISGGSVSYNNAKDGGGINCTGAALYLYGVSITGNTASNSGGGFKTGNTTATVSGVKKTFTPKVVMSGTYISNNKAKNGGGFILAGAGGTMQMYGGTVTDNEATACGGGAYISTNTTFTANGGTFRDNFAKSGGGAVYHLKSKGDYTDVSVYGNAVTTSGGAFFFSGAATAGEMKNVTIYDNSCEKGCGGAAYINNDVVWNFTDCNIYDNYAGTYGGGVYGAVGGHPVMNNCSVNGNEAVLRGGGILARDTLTVKDCVITENKAEYGAGVYVGNREETWACNGWGSKGDDVGMTMVGCTVSDNDATVDGGGLHVDMTCYSTIANCTFTGNTAGERGSAMWLWENTTMDDVTVTGNVCGSNGFAVYLADSEFDGQTYINGLFKFGGNMIIKDNEGGDLFLDNKVTIGETNQEYGPKTHMCVTLDEGLLTQRMMGVYNYEGGDLVYTVTYGDRSMTDPEYDPNLVKTAEAPAEETENKSASQDVWLYVGIGVIGLAAVAAVVLMILKKKKAEKPADASKN